MIRNIPNRLPQQTLVEIFNEKFPDSFDYFYLPIDPYTKVSYGYAFINFKTYRTIISFYEYFHHRKWTNYYFQKVCEMAYARYQGRVALIQHLKNSANQYKRNTAIIYIDEGNFKGEKHLNEVNL
ncbi:hypothetical protein DICPUDRAFT_44952 [Dictyostelium purpureum]|uniref:Mei2-like C-terminal RNA recognition motif domain-containing protein n=1 Tax=Dictyostelium purpureum TaxID=5786 RepID=F0Z886_DICPU|nr:uncharacterized protein DICPUDRAFT_44952 [Dictyostelium purpureum]EGC39887.1 hypothetical protein DICPUDRAFT_44952 [Dictyostelium purpureum]|eukprot:XP_003283638.1 hypothetical protein DICPUDRAFT_44952 [Dictyostelium purpureum]